MNALIKGIFIMLLVTGTAEGQNKVDQAAYFRVWQGFQKTELTPDQFLNELPTFMKDTVDLYQQRALNNYIVIIPPAHKPSFIPDELALVALNSKATYELIRNTPEGQKYSARHWDVFNKNNSKSATLINYTLDNPVNLIHNTAYDMIGNQINWAQGYNTVFIGIKKSELTSASFLQRLQNHVELAKSVMTPKGLLGYIVIANENYEVAYLNWESKQAHELARESQDGQAVFIDAGQIMDVLMYEEAIAIEAGQTVTPGHAYSTFH